MSTESTENWQIGLEAGWNFYCADDGWVGEHATYGKTDSAASYDAAEIGALHLQRRGAPRPPTEAEMLKAHREMMESRRDSLAVEIVTALNVADSLPAVQKVVEFYDLRELFEGVPLDKRFTAAESQAIGDAFERRALALGFSRAPAPAEVNSPPEGTLYQVDDGAGGTPQFGGVAVAGHAAPLAQQMLPSKILTHPSTLMRAGGLDAEHVESLRELYTAGASLPAVDVYFDGTSHWLGDGNHRHKAAGEAGALLDVRVHKGTLRDAILHAVRANAEHGLKRTNDDKRLAVVTLLSDPEWFRQSDTALAELARVTQPFVSSVRRDLATVADALPAAGDVSDEEVAEHFDVSAPLVRVVRGLPDEQRASITQNVLSDTGRRVGVDGVKRSKPTKHEEGAPLFDAATGEETKPANDVTGAANAETQGVVPVMLRKGHKHAVCDECAAQFLDVQIPVKDGFTCQSCVDRIGEEQRGLEKLYEGSGKKDSSDCGEREAEIAQAKAAHEPTGDPWLDNEVMITITFLPGSGKHGRHAYVDVEVGEGGRVANRRAAVMDHRLSPFEGYVAQLVREVRADVDERGKEAKRPAKKQKTVGANKSDRTIPDAFKVGDTVRVVDRDCINTFGMRGEIVYCKGDHCRAKIGGTRFEYRATQLTREKKTATRGPAQKASAVKADESKKADKKKVVKKATRRRASAVRDEHARALTEWVRDVRTRDGLARHIEHWELENDARGKGFAERDRLKVVAAIEARRAEIEDAGGAIPPRTDPAWDEAGLILITLPTEPPLEVLAVKQSRQSLSGREQFEFHGPISETGYHCDFATENHSITPHQYAERRAADMHAEYLRLLAKEEKEKKRGKEVSDPAKPLEEVTLRAVFEDAARGARDPDLLEDILTVKPDWAVQTDEDSLYADYDAQVLMQATEREQRGRFQNLKQLHGLKRQTRQSRADIERLSLEYDATYTEVANTYGVDSSLDMRERVEVEQDEKPVTGDDLETLKRRGANKFGVYVAGVESVCVVEARKKGRGDKVTLRVVQDGVDGKWRSAFDYSAGTGGGSHAPSLSGDFFDSREDALAHAAHSVAKSIAGQGQFTALQKRLFEYVEGLRADDSAGSAPERVGTKRSARTTRAGESRP